MQYERKDRWAVGYWMTENPQTVPPDMSVYSAFYKMRIEGYRHLLVVQDGELWGIVSDRDLRRPDISNEPDGWHEFYQLDGEYEVRDIMTTELITISPGDRLEKALHLMLENKFHSLPVLNKYGKLIGILTDFDLMRAFRQALDETGDILRSER